MHVTVHSGNTSTLSYVFPIPIFTGEFVLELQLGHRGSPLYRLMLRPGICHPVSHVVLPTYADRGIEMGVSVNSPIPIRASTDPIGA